VSLFDIYGIALYLLPCRNKNFITIRCSNLSIWNWRTYRLTFSWHRDIKDWAFRNFKNNLIKFWLWHFRLWDIVDPSPDQGHQSHLGSRDRPGREGGGQTFCTPYIKHFQNRENAKIEKHQNCYLNGRYHTIHFEWNESGINESSDDAPFLVIWTWRTMETQSGNDCQR
jgi:hypothetical protein